MLIGVEQLGDGYPVTALRRNFTPIPSQLAMGSTWNLPLVKEVGAIVGQELHAVGINLLLGPSLDVTNHPRTDAVGALGVHTFGGDPYWVGKMGQSYIAGIHEGSDYQLAAIARHFPGQGDIDRLPEQEVATVQQSLSELRDIALPPFFQVTRQSSSVIDPTGSNNTADGLMTSHMRFSAFQGTSSTRVPPPQPDAGSQYCFRTRGLYQLARPRRHSHDKCAGRPGHSPLLRGATARLSLSSCCA
ncbi:MAG: glycoside hydrolase family 3 N-terminal domain-containing protein [Caldilineaceae bacterium]